MHVVQASLGIVVFLTVAWLLARQRSTPPWRLIAVTLAMQFAIALALLRLPPVRDALFSLNVLVEAIETATLQGSGFVFGYLGGAATHPYAVTEGSATFVLAFRVLPQILVFSVLVAVLWHWRVLAILVRGMSWALRKTLGIGGAEALAATSNVFLGMVEAPLLIRAYLARMSRAELFSVMTCGMSTVAGSVMILYASVLDGIIDNPLGQVLSASVLAVPGSILLARLMYSADGTGTASDDAEPLVYDSTMDAVTRGTADGLRLVVNIGAMLIVLVALVAFVNGMLSALPDVAGAALSLERLLGWVFAPVAWLLGIPWHECVDAGGLLGTKLVLNELVAFVRFGELGADAFAARTDLTLTYALSGFANFGSLGIMLGGLHTLVPERRADVLELAPWSLVSGTLASLLAGAIVAIVVG